jgi:hypothetical protein
LDISQQTVSLRRKLLVQHVFFQKYLFVVVARTFDTSGERIAIAMTIPSKRLAGTPGKPLLLYPCLKAI